jgi:phosphoribosyl 1,2-cyclic phosphodiesterase
MVIMRRKLLLKVSLLASGSKGNAVYLESGETRLLIDAGLSAVEILRRLEIIGVDPASLDAVLISHDHNDHIRGAGTLARKLKIPVVVSYPTRGATESFLKKCGLVEFESGYSFAFRDLLIDPFPITHDATDPVGFIIESNEGRIGFATDLGIVTRLVREKLKDCRILILEANHDEEMLMNGPYPWHLKQRIKSRHGHISNTESMELLQDTLHDALEGVFLAHLSEVNNDPQLPHLAATALLSSQNCCSPQLFIGNQHSPSKILKI